jgi:hypothetical protein
MRQAQPEAVTTVAKEWPIMAPHHHRGPPGRGDAPGPPSRSDDTSPISICCDMAADGPVVIEVRGEVDFATVA